MIRKPSPIHSLWKGFKIFTCVFSTAYSMLLSVAGIIFLSAGAIGLCLLLHAGFVYWCGQSIGSSLKLEEVAEMREDTEDEETKGPEDGPGSV